MATTQQTLDTQAALTLEIDGDGVAWLVFDRPSSRVNLLDEAVMMRLDALIEELEEHARTGRAKVVVVRSGKDGSFIAGANVSEIAGIDDPAEAASKAASGQAVFRRLERLPIPTIAMIDGTCLGGGTELALACAYRLASDRPETRIGLPETQLGIIPGFGGTVRLPRLIGAQAALEMILSGRPVSASRAERIGLIDERVPAELLEDRTRRFAWDRIDRGRVRPRRKRPFLARLLEDTAPGRRILFQQARRRVMKQTRGHYPAPLAAIETVRDTLSMPLDRAFEREAEVVGRLIASPVSKNLIHVFFQMEAAKKAGPDAEPRAIERAAVLGAGVMGGGIAQLLAYRGLPVRLRDIRSEALTLGLNHARELFDHAVRRRRLDEREARQAMQRIAPTLDYSGFGTADLVIEAVVERMDVKKQVLREVEEKLPAQATLVSNTSALSISEMQKALERPENFCGMHFFNPVHRMPLVEVVRGAASSDETVATVVALALRLGKTPVLVNDGPGFLVNRLLGPYLNEAGWLLTEGASIEQIDRVLLDFGMPMGPLRLLDEVGLDVSRHVAAILYEGFGERMSPAPPLIQLAETARLGRKSGLGFYRYANGKKQGPDESIYSELGESVPSTRTTLPPETIRDRTILVMVNEAARALEDGIVETPGEVDLALITGTGFPPFRGGLLRYADSVGLRTVVERLEGFERELGARFQPAPLLRERAEAGHGFHD